MLELAQATVAPQAGELSAEGQAPVAAPQAPAPSIPSPFAEVSKGLLPAVSLAPVLDGTPDPAQEFIISNFPNLSDLGLEYLEFPDASSAVYNPSSISEKDLQTAFESGTLAEVAPPANAPLAAPEAAPAAPDALAAPAAPPAASPGALAGATAQPAAGSPVDQSLQAARLKNLAPAPRAAPNPVPGQLARRAV